MGALIASGQIVADVEATLATLATFFDRFERPEVAATLYGASTYHANLYVINVINLAGVAEHLRIVLSASRLDECVAAGAAMELGEAVRYAREQIQTARAELVGAMTTAGPTGPTLG